jgi:hypothetical protein
MERITAVKLVAALGICIVVDITQNLKIIYVILARALKEDRFGRG